MVKKKYTRKQLKQPDEFIVASTGAWAWVSKNAKGVMVMTAVVLVIVGIASILRQRSDTQAKDATAELSRAIEIYNQTVIPGADKLPKAEDGLPRFSTRKAKLEATVASLDKVLKHSSSGISYLALMLRAGAHYDLGHYDKAATDYESYLGKIGTDQPRFRRTAIEGLTYCYEAQKQWDKALSTLAKLEKKGEQRYAALYHEGRILAAKGDKAEAIKRFKEIVDKATARSLVDQAGQRLAVLQSK